MLKAISRRREFITRHRPRPIHRLSSCACSRKVEFLNFSQTLGLYFWNFGTHYYTVLAAVQLPSVVDSSSKMSGKKQSLPGSGTTTTR